MDVLLIYIKTMQHKYINKTLFAYPILFLEKNPKKTYEMQKAYNFELNYSMIMLLKQINELVKKIFLFWGLILQIYYAYLLVFLLTKFYEKRNTHFFIFYHVIKSDHIWENKKYFNLCLINDYSFSIIN